MNKKLKGKTYKCPHCKTREFIPENEFGIRTSQITAIICPLCLCPRPYCSICRGKKHKCKGHQFRMEEVK